MFVEFFSRFFIGRRGYMKVKQILNNNVAILTKGTNEVIVYSKGIAFRKKVGQSVSKEEVDKVFVLDSADVLEHFSYLLANTEESLFEIVRSIILRAEELFQKKATDYLYLTLLDHIDYALKRGKKGQYISNPLLWEVRRYYPKSYQLGVEVVERLNKEYNVSFPEDEAASIALHLVNIQEAVQNSQENEKVTEIMKDIVSIVQYHFGAPMNHESINYTRFMQHLQYFVQRILTNDTYSENDSELYQQISQLYPEAYGAVKKIELYVIGTFGKLISEDEKTYLMMHIHRMTERTEKRKERKRCVENEI